MSKSKPLSELLKDVDPLVLAEADRQADEVIKAMLRVVDAIWIKDFLFYVELSDGVSGVVDFMPLTLKHSIFKQIMSDEKPEYYATEDGVITWYNGANIAPEWVRDNLLCETVKSDMLRVVDVDEGNKPYSLFVALSDGSKGYIDFAPLIASNKQFSKLDTIDKFHAFGLEHGSLRWDNGLDIDPLWIKENMGKSFGESLIESANQAKEIAIAMNNGKQIETHAEKVRLDAIRRANINFDNPCEAEKRFLAMWADMPSNINKERLLELYIDANAELDNRRTL